MGVALTNPNVMQEVNPHRIRVLHIISGLPVGGAQTMLYNLLEGTDRRTFKCEVVSLTEAGPVGKRITDLGVPVRALNMRKSFPNPLDLINLARVVHASRADIVQTWMYHADLIGGLVSKIGYRKPCVWNIRQSNYDRHHNRRSTIWIAHICSKISRWLPHTIICNAEASASFHIGLGYCAEKFLVIPNGVDSCHFQPRYEMMQKPQSSLG